MAQTSDPLQELRELVAQLTRRVYRLEEAARSAGVVLADEPPGSAAVPPPPAAHALPQIAVRPPVMPPEPPPMDFTQPKAKGPGLESKIGTHWLNRIGIAAMLIGAAYFLKYAFDNQWIGPSGRVAIGLLAGIGIVAWSERFRGKGYVVFSYSLKAVGVGILYLSLWAAFQLYHLLPAPAAFIAMIAVTAVTAFLALQQDAEVLAALAIIGGFATPLLVSTGENHEVALFSYLALLDLAALVLVALRPWRRVLVGAFVATVLLFVGWYDSYYDSTQLGTTFGFATLFFAIFAAAPLVGSKVESERAGARPRTSATLLLLPIANTAVYFFQAYAMLEAHYYAWLAWFSLALAAVSIGLSRAAGASRTERESRDLRLLHIALAISLITVAVPLKLKSHWITTGWIVEAGALLWVGRRAESKLLRVLAIAALALGVARLLMFDDFYSQRVLLNARFGTYLVAIAVLALLARFGAGFRRETDDVIRAVAVVALNALALIGLTREAADAYNRGLVQASGDQWHSLRVQRDFVYSALWMIYGAGLMAVGFWKRSAFLRWQALILIAVTVVKVFVYDLSELERIYRVLSFIVLGAILLGISFAYQRDWLKLSARAEEGERT